MLEPSRIFSRQFLSGTLLYRSRIINLRFCKKDKLNYLLFNHIYINLGGFNVGMVLSQTCISTEARKITIFYYMDIFSFDFWCKVQVSYIIDRLAPCTKCKRLVYRMFVSIEDLRIFEPMIHAD